MKQSVIYDVFLSYSSIDSEFAEKIYEGLSEKGIRVFHPLNSIKPGVDYIEVIQECIRSAKVIIPIITKNSVQSNFVKKEIALAVDRKKLVMPIVTESTEIDVELKYLLSEYIWLRIKEDESDVSSIVDEIYCEISRFS